MSRKKLRIPGGYLPVPHRIIKRAIAAKALNSEARALIHAVNRRAKMTHL